MLKKTGISGYSGTLKNLAAAAAFGLASLALISAARLSPSFVSDVYAPWSRALERALSAVFSPLPFSAAEVILYLGFAAAAVWLVCFAVRLVRGPGRLKYAAFSLSAALLAASVIAFCFYASWGLNYRSPGLASALGLETKARSSAELAELNGYLLENANRLAVLQRRGKDGSIEGPGFREAAAAAAAEFSKTTGRREDPPKYVMASVPMSYLQTTGIFTFYTGEANINTNSTPASIPFTMAHEMSHRCGIAPENEANFFAFYSLRGAEDPLTAYSAYMMALTYCQNRLYSADRVAWKKLASEYCVELSSDYRQYSLHWDRYEGKAAEVSEAVNDSYLHSQGQASGVDSYGEMVDLMLAWYEAEIKQGRTLPSPF